MNATDETTDQTRVALDLRTMGNAHQTAIEGMLPKFRSFGFPVMADILSDGDGEGVMLRVFEVSKQDALMTYLKATAAGDGRQYVPEGRYVKLLVYSEEREKWEVMMSDTPHEREETRRALRGLRGDVLIAGLGLGMLVHAAARKRSVRSVTVVELNPEIIRLVGPTLPKNVRVVQGDARTWLPDDGATFDSIFLDIWPNIGDEMHAETQTMLAHYAPLLRAGGWMEAWLQYELDAAQRAWDIVMGAWTDHKADPLKTLGFLNSRLHRALEEAKDELFKRQLSGG